MECLRKGSADVREVRSAVTATRKVLVYNMVDIWSGVQTRDDHKMDKLECQGADIKHLYSPTYFSTTILAHHHSQQPLRYRQPNVLKSIADNDDSIQMHCHQGGS